jgi:hypothetical protein
VGKLYLYLYLYLYFYFYMIKGEIILKNCGCIKNWAFTRVGTNARNLRGEDEISGR